jgi:zinc protease
LPATGTLKSLTALTGDKVRRLYDHYFAPARLVVSAAGDVNTVELRKLLEKPRQSAGWTQKAKPLTYAKAPVFAAPDKGQPPLTVRQMNTPTAWVFVAYNTAGMNAGDYVALRVLAAAMGESSRARLPDRLLGKRGGGSARGAQGSATSQVAVQLTPRRFAGELIFFAQTNPQSVESIKNAMLDEVRKLKEQPLTRPELESARNFVRGNWAVERESLRERAFQGGLAQVANAAADTTWPDRVIGVSAADIQRVAKKYLENYAVALIMPQD